MTNSEPYEAAAAALGPNATVEEVNAIVALMDNLNDIGMLDNETVAKALVDSGKKIQDAIRQFLEITQKAAEKDPTLPAPMSLSSKSLEELAGDEEVSSLEASSDAGSQGPSLEEILEKGQIEAGSLQASAEEVSCPDCPGVPVTTARYQSGTVEKWCSGCKMVLHKEQGLSASDQTELAKLNRQVAALTAHYSEGNYALTSRSLEEIADGSTGKSLEDILDGSGKSLEEIAGEVEA